MSGHTLKKKRSVVTRVFTEFDPSVRVVELHQRRHTCFHSQTSQIPLAKRDSTWRKRDPTERKVTIFINAFLGSSYLKKGGRWRRGTIAGSQVGATWLGGGAGQRRVWAGACREGGQVFNFFWGGGWWRGGRGGTLV